MKCLMRFLRENFWNFYSNNTMYISQVKMILEYKLRPLKFCVLSIVLISLTSCASFFSDNECENLIENEKMIEIMTDIYLMESYIKEELSRDTIRNDSIAYLYAGIFKKHRITKEKFDKAFECYASNKEKITYLNEEVLNAIQIIEEID